MSSRVANCPSTQPHNHYQFKDWFIYFLMILVAVTLCGSILLSCRVSAETAYSDRNLLSQCRIGYVQYG